MVNICTMSGNLGSDPTLRQAGDYQIACFSLGVYESKDSTMWINCEVWGKRADTIMQYYKKGAKATVSGSLKINIYKEQKYPTINVRDFDLPPREKPNNNGFDDNIPF